LKKLAERNKIKESFIWNKTQEKLTILKRNYKQRQE
jgi:hypothetical protein